MVEFAVPASVDFAFSCSSHERGLRLRSLSCASSLTCSADAHPSEYASETGIVAY